KTKTQRRSDRRNSFRRKNIPTNRTGFSKQRRRTGLFFGKIPLRPPNGKSGRKTRRRALFYQRATQRPRRWGNPGTAVRHRNRRGKQHHLHRTREKPPG